MTMVEDEQRCPLCNSTQLIEGENGLECQACDWKDENSDLEEGDEDE